MTDDQSADSPTFLIVDDNDQIRHLICQALEKLGPHRVIEAGDGLEARQILLDTSVDVAVTDVLMPRMDGRELMRWAQEHCPDPLWIVLSGLETFDAAVDALQLGAFDFLVKPVRVSRLRVAVRNALNQIALRNERTRLYRELEERNATLSRQVDQLSSLCRMLEDQSQLIHEDLARAEVIQRALLPRTPPKLAGWCIETLYRPGRYVGGDLYDVFDLDDRHLGLVVADAAGHGVAAAMLSVLLKNRLTVRDDETHQPLEPQEVLRRANAMLHADTSSSGSFITASYLLLDLDTGRARLAAAGHPPALWVNDRDRRLLDRTGPALGLTEDAAYQQEHFTLAAGDRLMLYTDGLLDGGPSAFDHDALGAALATRDEDPGDLLRRFYEAATHNASHDPDDVTVVLLERAEGISRYDDADSIKGTAGPAPALPTADEMQLLQGDADAGGFLCVCGTGTWTRGQAFFDAATAITAARGHAIIDLHDCRYLDSTFLGTLYELVLTHTDAIHLQRVPQPLRALFDELSMQAVIDRIAADALPLPERLEPLIPADADTHQQAHRLLVAHEILASLSDENRAQFQSVVDALRHDLGR